MSPEEIAKIFNAYGPAVFSVLATFILGIVSTVLFWLFRTIQQLVVGFAELRTEFRSYKQKSEKDMNNFGKRIRSLEENSF